MGRLIGFAAVLVGAALFVTGHVLDGLFILALGLLVLVTSAPTPFLGDRILARAPRQQEKAHATSTEWTADYEERWN